MSLLKLPDVRADFRLGAAQFDLRSDALERWAPEVRAAQEDAATVSIYDVIGEDSWTGEGMTSKRVSGILRSIGEKDINVNINSPGGDFFEGVAIYNLLREHKGKVTVRVMGLAASAASVIAMAGDEVLMGDGAFLMVHNAWTVTLGNRHDLLEAAERLEPFDIAMADLYAARSGMSRADAQALMDKETWLGAQAAVDKGLATGVLSEDEITQDTKARVDRKTMAVIEAAMAKAGHSRTARREAFQSLFSGKPGAAEKTAMPSAGDEVAASLQSLLNILKG